MLNLVFLNLLLLVLQLLLGSLMGLKSSDFVLHHLAELVLSILKLVGCRDNVVSESCILKHQLINFPLH